MDTLTHEPDCVCKACCDARLAGKRKKKPKNGPGLPARLTDASAKRQPTRSTSVLTGRRTAPGRWPASTCVAAAAPGRR